MITNDDNGFGLTTKIIVPKRTQPDYNSTQLPIEQPLRVKQNGGLDLSFSLPSASAKNDDNSHEED